MAEAKRGFRPEIQALRAIAVLAVVLFHLWPDRFTGGYAGVDVFFVISGYLITSHLLREAESTGTISLSRFYARRIRRLLPAAMLVLAATVVGVLTLSSMAQWRQFFTEIAGSAVYIVNWILANNAVDYFAADNSPSPVQHYWSLSVEEQFYLVWPLLILATYAITKASPVLRRRMLVGLVWLLTIVSLGYSIWLTAQSAQYAYFATPTHGWEFGAGALIAIYAKAFASERWASLVSLRAALSWIGVALIAASVFIFTASTPFPGYLALVPVVGAGLVIASGVSSARWSPSFLMGLRPVQFVGDISYSLYLWHWPLIIFVPSLLGHDLGNRDKLVIFAISVVLAWLTRRFVEVPTTAGKFFSRRRVSYGFAIVASIAVVGASFAPIQVLDAQARNVDSYVEKSVASGDPCFGAEALVAGDNCNYLHTINPEVGNDPNSFKVPVPSKSSIPTPGSDGYIDTCSTSADGIRSCTMGSKNPDAVIALVGDSHAEALEPAMEYQLLQNNWQLIEITKRSCPPVIPSWKASADLAYKEGEAACGVWREKMITHIADDPTIDVVVAASYDRRYVEPGGKGTDLTKAFAETWKPWTDAGKQVVVISDVPRTDSPANCPAAVRGKVLDCPFARTKALTPDPLSLSVAASKSPAVSLINITPSFCDPKACHSIVGGVIVYKDRHHITPVFSRSLGPVITPELRDAVRRSSAA